MRNQLLSLLVTNHFGVLMRVTNLFSRRGYNIKALTVGETENPEMSRITILTEGDDNRIAQITKQLEKLEDVHRVAQLEDGRHIARELLLLKVSAPGEDLDAFAALIETARTAGLAEICRTGATGMQTGDDTLA